MHAGSSHQRHTRRVGHSPVASHHAARGTLTSLPFIIRRAYPDGCRPLVQSQCPLRRSMPSANRRASEQTAAWIVTTPSLRGYAQRRAPGRARGRLHGVRYRDTMIDAEGNVVTDPALAARIDRDWYTDDGQLIRREWFLAAPRSGHESKS